MVRAYNPEIASKRRNTTQKVNQDQESRSSWQFPLITELVSIASFFCQVNPLIRRITWVLWRWNWKFRSAFIYLFIVYICIVVNKFARYGFKRCRISKIIYSPALKTAPVLRFERATIDLLVAILAHSATQNDKILNYKPRFFIL